MSLVDESKKSDGSRRQSRIIWRVFGCFYTTYLSIVVLGVTSLSASGLLSALVIGCSIDALRRLVAPEFVVQADQLVGSFERAGVKGPDTSKHRRKLNIAFFGASLVFVGYVPLLMLGESTLGSATLKAWVAHFAPVTQLATDLVPLIQRHSTQLAAIGQEDKARVLAHIYASSLLMMVIVMVIGARGLAFSIALLDQRPSKEDGTLRFSHKRKKQGAILLPLFPLFCWLALNYMLEPAEAGIIGGKYVGLYPFFCGFTLIIGCLMACQSLGAWLVAATGPAGSRLEKM